MKNIWLISIIIAWVIISVVGMLSWECRADMYEGIILSLGICIGIYSISSFAKQNNEYDEYGDYRKRY